MPRPTLREGEYRYRLDETPQGGGRGRVAIIQMNPSLADGNRSDPTVGKIKVWAEGNYGLIVFLNLYAFVHPKQDEIPVMDYLRLVGPRNDSVIRDEVASADKVIVAWGRPKGILKTHYLRRVSEVFEILDGIRIFRVGGLSHGKYPRHGRMWNEGNRNEVAISLEDLRSTRSA